MNIKCSNCGKEFDSSNEVCPFCFTPKNLSFQSESGFSIKGIGLIFVKRENKKIFGPFPTDRVFDLVKQNKLKPDEEISQDKEQWHKVSSVLEFKEYFADNNDSESLPGIKPAESLPGIKPAESLPGIKPAESLPGIKPAESLPGINESLPSKNEALPGKNESLPTKNELLPVEKSSESLPQKAAQSLPDFKKGNEDEAIPISGSSPSFPPIPDKEENKSGSEDKEVLLDENFSLLEEDVDVSSTLDSTAFSDEIKSTLTARDNLPSSSLELSAVENEREDSGALPDFVASVEKNSKVERPKGLSSGAIDKSKGSGVYIGLIAVVAFIVIGLLLEWTFGFVGIFGSDSQKQKVRVTRRQKTRRNSSNQNKANTSDKNKNKDPVLFFAKSVLTDMLKSKNKNKACEAALFLVLHHHDFSGLSKCSFIAKKTPSYSSNPVLTRINILRLLLLKTNFSSEIKNLFIDNSVVEKKLKKPEALLAQAVSSHKKSPVWNIFEGYFLFYSGKPEKALQAFVRASALSSGEIKAVTFMSALCGDKDALNKLGKDKTRVELYEFAKQFLYFENMLKGYYSFIPQQNVPLVKIIKHKKNSFLGNRFLSVNMAFAAYKKWTEGDLTSSLNLCSKAVNTAPYSLRTDKICFSIWLYHGLTSNFSHFDLAENNITLYPYKIYEAIMSGEIVKKTALFEKLKSLSSKKADVIAPLVLGSDFTVKDKDILKTVSAAIKADKYEALTFIYLLANLRMDLIPALLTSLKNESKSSKDKYLQSALKELSSKLTIISMFYNSNWEGILKHKPDKKSSAYIPEISSYGIALAKTGKTRDLQNWLSVYADKIRNSVWGSSAFIIANKNNASETAKVVQVIEKLEGIIKSPLFYNTVALFYLDGTGKNRLLRAKYFIDKSVKINSVNPYTLYIYGRTLIESGRTDAGEKTLIKAIAASHKDPEQILKWADLEISLKRFDAALKALDFGLKYFPGNSDFIYKKAESFYNRGNPKKALEVIANAKKNKFKFGFEIYLLEGKIYQKLHQRNDAEKAFKEAVALNPKNAELNYLYGESLISNGKVAKSVTYLEAALSIKKKVDFKKDKWIMEAHRLLGGAYKELGKKDKAIMHFRKYSAMVPPGPMKDEALRLLRLLGAD